LNSFLRGSGYLKLLNKKVRKKERKKELEMTANNEKEKQRKDQESKQTSNKICSNSIIVYGSERFPCFFSFSKKHRGTTIAQSRSLLNIMSSDP
jgi:hypothetical protein